MIIKTKHQHLRENDFLNLCFRFLLQCLSDLDNSLKKLNSRLFVIKGQPAEALPKLFRVSFHQITSDFKLAQTSSLTLSLRYVI